MVWFILGKNIIEFVWSWFRKLATLWCQMFMFDLSSIIISFPYSQVMVKCRMKITISMVEDLFGYLLNGLLRHSLPAHVHSSSLLSWRLLYFAVKIPKKGFLFFFQLAMEYLLDCFASFSCFRLLSYNWFKLIDSFI